MALHVIIFFIVHLIPLLNDFAVSGLLFTSMYLLTPHPILHIQKCLDHHIDHQIGAIVAPRRPGTTALTRAPLLDVLITEKPRGTTMTIRGTEREREKGKGIEIGLEPTGIEIGIMIG